MLFGNFHQTVSNQLILKSMVCMAMEKKQQQQDQLELFLIKIAITQALPCPTVMRPHFLAHQLHV